MSLNLVSEMWDILKPSIQVGDVNEAAELLVNYLVDNDYDPQDIKKTFKRDLNIQQAVGYYIESPGDEFSKYDEEEEFYDDEEDYRDDYDEDEDNNY